MAQALRRQSEYQIWRPEQFQEDCAAVGLGDFAVAYRPELRKTKGAQFQENRAAVGLGDFAVAFRPQLRKPGARLRGTAQLFRPLPATAGCLADSAPGIMALCEAFHAPRSGEAIMIEECLDSAVGIAIKSSLGDDAVLAEIVASHPRPAL